MSKQPAKMQSWQVFHFARKYLGRSVLFGIFGRKNARTVEYWCEDPRFTHKPDDAYDPIRGTKALLELLDDQGYCDVVRSCVSYMLSGTSLGEDIDPQVVEPKPTMAEEILADYKAVARLQQGIEEHEDIEAIDLLMKEAIAEVERTVAKYRHKR